MLKGIMLYIKEDVRLYYGLVPLNVKKAGRPED